MFKKCFILVFVVQVQLIFSQTNLNYRWPINPPLTLTGNYGELRPNHFHAGVDFSTQNNTGWPVYAAAAGYVSRIRLSSVGYGKCIYITHPDGYVTVYAHLKSFSEKLDGYLKAEMKKQKVNEIDHYPNPAFLPVTSSEIIGLSGNSGGSSGPHLHFEIREEKSEIPLNPLKLMPLPDSFPPKINQIAFFDLSDSIQPRLLKTHLTKLHSVSSVPKIEIPTSVIGLAYSASDRLYAGGNLNNVYAVDLYLDGQLIYLHHFDHIEFSDGRYVNEFAASHGGTKLQKCFLPSVYPNKFDVSANNKGRIIFSDTAYHLLRLVVFDETGNKDESGVLIRSNGKTNYKMVKRKATLINCALNQTLNENGLLLKIPARTLYYSAAMQMELKWAPKPYLQIFPEDLNFNSSVELSFEPPVPYLKNADKLVLKSANNVSAAILRNDSVFFNLKNAGRYEILVDSIPPSLKVQHAKNKHLNKILVFNIADKLSGIYTYNLFLNNDWVLCEYDAKLGELTYYFDENASHANLNFKLEVTDRAGNQASLNYSIN